MKLLRLVASDLHIGKGAGDGELNPIEDFFQDDRFAEMLAYYDQIAGEETDAELILNGDIFDLLKVKIDNTWPREVTEQISEEKLRQCLEGHPKFVAALRNFISRGRRRIVYLPGNHDIEMWFAAPQELFRRYVAPGELNDRVRFITDTDAYYLPEGIQIRHGHQLERIHRVDYSHMTRKRRDRSEVLDLPWGYRWILEVVNPAKERRSYVDRIHPFTLFLWGALIFDTVFGLKFILHTAFHYLRHRVFAFRAWPRRLRNLPNMLREEVFAIGGYDDVAMASFLKLRGAHTLIVGHSHIPRYSALKNGKVLINTGTWMQMINLTLQHLGENVRLTYALIEYPEEGRPRARLMRWYGTQPPCEPMPYAD